MNKQEIMNKYLEPVRQAICNIPEVVSLELTTRCQLDCIYCNRDKSQVQDLDVDKLNLVKDRLTGVKKIIICGVGESFCYSNLYRAIEILKDYKISIVTNGAMPIDFAKLTQANVELLVFSVDVADPIRMEGIAKGYNFDVVKRNLVNLWKYPRISRIFNATINEYNVDELVNLIQFAKDYKMHALNIELPIGQNDFVKENRDLIRQQMKEAIQLSKKLNLPINQFFSLPCNSNGSMYPIIKVNGDVVPCCFGMYKGNVIGNIYEADIKEIWNDEVRDLLNNNLCLQCEQIKNLLTVSTSF